MGGFFSPWLVNSIDLLPLHPLSLLYRNFSPFAQPSVTQFSPLEFVCNSFSALVTTTSLLSRPFLLISTLLPFFLRFLNLGIDQPLFFFSEILQNVLPLLLQSAFPSAPPPFCFLLNPGATPVFFLPYQESFAVFPHGQREFNSFFALSSLTSAMTFSSSSLPSFLPVGGSLSSCPLFLSRSCHGRDFLGSRMSWTRCSPFVYIGSVVSLSTTHFLDRLCGIPPAS